MTIITMKQNDTFPPLRAYLQMANGSPITLPEAEVRLFVKDKEGNFKINTLVDIVDPSKGYVEYNWKSTDTDTVGEYLAELEITFQVGNKLTVPSDGYITLNITKEIG